MAGAFRQITMLTRTQHGLHDVEPLKKDLRSGRIYLTSTNTIA